MNKRIKFTTLGGAVEIGANSYLIEWNNKNILLDCGINQREFGYASFPALEKIHNEIDAIIISHAHIDHIGTLPVIMNKYPQAKVFMTPATQSLTVKLLIDAGNIMGENAKAEGWLPYYHLYNPNMINSMIYSNRVMPVNLNSRFNIADEIYAEFYDAGHILGSMITVLSDGYIRVLYTGDVSVKETFCEKGADYKNIKNIDLLISESTYGDDWNNIPKSQELGRLTEMLNFTFQRGGSVLFPAFATGRTQEILLTLDYLKTKNRISDKIPVYLAGMGISVNRIYTEFKKIKFNITKELNFRQNSEDRLLMFKEIAKPAIFIATNGMLKPPTAAYEIAQILMERENCDIIFPSIFGEEESGYKQLQKKGKEIKCRIEKVDFSAHAKGKEIFEMIENINPKSVSLVHGTKSAINKLVTKLATRNYKITYPNFVGEEIILNKSEIGQIKLGGTGNMNAIIITVGTSMLSNYNKDSNQKSNPRCPDEQKLYEFLIKNPRSNSAELNTVLNIYPELPKYRYFLICSTDKKGAGIRCGNVLKMYFDKRNLDAEIVAVEGLCEDSEKFRNQGLHNFIMEMINVIEKYKDTMIFATGGYKAVTAFATLIGTFYNKPVYYVHEDFISKNPVIELPRYPFNFDFTEFHEYTEVINTVLNAETIEKADDKIKELPPDLINLLYRNVREKRYILNPLGIIISRAYEHWIKNYNDKKTNIEAEPRNVLPGLITQNADKKIITLSDIIDPGVKNKIAQILKINQVLRVAFRRYNIQKQTQNIIKSFTLNKYGKGWIEYKVIVKEGYQIIKIFVIASFEKVVINKIGESGFLTEDIV